MTLCSAARSWCADGMALALADVVKSPLEMKSPSGIKSPPRTGDWAPEENPEEREAWERESCDRCRRWEWGWDCNCD